jgi:uncharacterized OB-fold protein
LGVLVIDLTTVFRVTDDEQVELLGSRCPQCGQAAFLRRFVCPNCFNRDQQEAALPGRGVVVRTALVNVPPWGFDEPVTVGFVRLDAGPEIFTLLSGAQHLEPGDPVVAHPTDVRSGAPGFRFGAAP